MAPAIPASAAALERRCYLPAARSTAPSSYFNLCAVCTYASGGQPMPVESMHPALRRLFYSILLHLVRHAIPIDVRGCGVSTHARAVSFQSPHFPFPCRHIYGSDGGDGGEGDDDGAGRGGVRARDAEKLEFIEKMTKGFDAEQVRVLAEILARNNGAEYLRRHGMEGCTDQGGVQGAGARGQLRGPPPGDRAHRQRRPLQHIISSHPITEFLTSSGTSAGERKLMPTIEDEINRRQMLYSLLMPVMNLYVPGLDKGKGLYFLFIKSETKTPGGLPARPVLTSYYKSDIFKHRPYDPYNVYTEPDGRHPVHGLVPVHVRADAVRPAGPHRARSRNPPSATPWPEALRGPNPALADLVEAECKEQGQLGADHHPRVWPNTKYLDVIVTGAMAQYLPTLMYYSGGLPMACTMYASSECYFGLNLRPMCDPSEVSYTIMPNMGYFELLPHDPEADNAGNGSPPPRLVDLVDAEVGKEYELFRFVRRKNVLLSIDSDKTDEAELQAAVERASRLLEPYGAGIVEYTSQADAATIPGHYVVYWELMVREESGKWPEPGVFDRCCLEMEEALNAVYRQGRNGDAIGPLEIRGGARRHVRGGHGLRHLARRIIINQYKAPRCVSFGPIIELLNSRVLSKHFSPAYPRYSPHNK
ncbi:hypothetical protein PR202_gb04646 [Eleusine coracana subsp. coracana]|uniref:Uncharacterized protein n=1 Tax=Eleusine coracana subsp. coracana TaxID=191504 RepID=A0AAV5E4C6_ELECO|nr:hypothetical protein PR202_gb04646 [Eleusine coracana subsp. coracana]